MKGLKIEKRKLFIDGREEPVFSAEVHGFRLRRGSFRDRLKKIKDAGFKLIGTYIPWIVHEPEEGSFDFEGASGDHADLVGWLDAIAESGLYVIARPGPYVYSELKNAGVPDWFFERCPEAICKYRDSGKWVERRRVASYLHPDFLGAARRWMEAVLAVVARYQVSKDGPVVAVQLCNEIPGIQIWRGAEDQNPEAVGAGREDGLYPAWLARKYGSLDALNEAHVSECKSFADAQPPDVRPLDPESLPQSDYREFYWREYVPRYIDELASWTRGCGIDAPLCLNPANAIYLPDYAETARRHPDFLFGVDLYFSGSPSKRYDAQAAAFYTDFAAGLMREYQSGPVASLEFEGGQYVEFSPELSGAELAAWTKWSFLAGGFSMVNYYMFCGGTNPPRTGMGSTYNYQASIRESGRLSEKYFALKGAMEFVRSLDWLLGSERLYDLDVGFCPRPGLEPIEPNMLLQGFSLSRLSGNVRDLPRMAREGSWPDGRALLVCGTKVMGHDTQEALAEWIEVGGRVLIYGPLPELGASLRPCRLLAEALSVGPPPAVAHEEAGIARGFESIVTEMYFGEAPVDGTSAPEGDEIYVGRPVGALSLRREAKPSFETLARTGKGEPAVVSGRLGKGSFILVPFEIRWMNWSQTRFLRWLVSSLTGVQPLVRAEKFLGCVRRLSNNELRGCLYNPAPETREEEVELAGKLLTLSLPAFGVDVMRL